MRLLFAKQPVISYNDEHFKVERTKKEAHTFSMCAKKKSTWGLIFLDFSVKQNQGPLLQMQLSEKSAELCRIIIEWLKIIIFFTVNQCLSLSPSLLLLLLLF